MKRTNVVLFQSESVFLFILCFLKQRKMGKDPSLAWHDHKTCAKHILLCNITLLAGIFSKECQSFVHLKVAQATFAQLSEVSFDQ